MFSYCRPEMVRFMKHFFLPWPLLSRWAAWCSGLLFNPPPPAFPQQVRLRPASQEKPRPAALLFLKVRGRSSFGLAASAPARPSWRGCRQTSLSLLASLSRAGLGADVVLTLRDYLFSSGVMGPDSRHAPVIAAFVLS